MKNSPICGDSALLDLPDCPTTVVCTGPDGHIGYHAASAGGIYIYRWLLPDYPVWRVVGDLPWGRRRTGR